VRRHLKPLALSLSKGKQGRSFNSLQGYALAESVGVGLALFIDGKFPAPSRERVFVVTPPKALSFFGPRRRGALGAYECFPFRQVGLARRKATLRQCGSQSHCSPARRMSPASPGK